MEFTGPHKYELVISGKNGRLQKMKEGALVNFSQPITNTKQPKIYLILNGNEIVYVGYASQGISGRFYKGLKAKGDNGYHGYAWKELEEAVLFVFVFESFTGDKTADAAKKLFVEAVEAELVYIVRNKYGEWPKYQNEIHFNNKQRHDVLSTSLKIFEEIENYLKPHPQDGSDF